MSDRPREDLRGKLPLDLPEPCPICGAKVVLTCVEVWGEDGTIEHVDYGCVTEPDIDSAEWREWFDGHYRMPYVDWLPYERAMLRWLDGRYFYSGDGDT